MRAYFGATGISICVGKEDKGKRRLECIIDDGRSARLLLQIRNHVNNTGHCEEPGFHIQCWPPNISSRRCTKMFVYLSEENWNKLTTEWDREAGGGFWMSRCKYDRCHFHYYDPEHPANPWRDK